MLKKVSSWEKDSRSEDLVCYLKLTPRPLTYTVTPDKVICRNYPLCSSKLSSTFPSPRPLDSEAQRLRALERYDILDTAPESAFDELTLLAASVCQTPISLISLLDHRRQWFKSRIGLDVTETERSIAFCNHVLAPQAPFEVPDATTDPRFANNPLVTGHPNIRFYAGVPLLTADNYCLGTICVIDTKPRILTNSQRQALTTIAAQVMAQLDIRLRKSLERASSSNEQPLSSSFLQLQSMVGEEVKRPLANLLNLADLVLADARQGDAAAAEETLKMMSTEVGRLHQKISSLAPLSPPAKHN